MFTRYKNADLVVLGATFFTEGGDWRSIYLYAKQAQNAGRQVIVINPRAKRGLRQALAVWAFAPRALVNGLNSFDSLCVLAMCLFRRDVRIYLHETDHALDGYQQAHPLRYSLLRRILSRNPLLCVSQKAEALYRERFGATTTHVIYECPGDEDRVKLEPGYIHIVNVGTLNERKGVELFSKVADLAKGRHPEWRFHWVGGIATMSQLYCSPAVQWHGFTWHPTEFVKQCNLFFLSSVDDPCPLSALEALQEGLRCVAYKDTGTAEIMSDLKGCRVFQSYCAEAAMQQIEEALQQTVDLERQKSKLGGLVGLRAFDRSIEACFQQ